jgi:para-nitrobenzyl esterase
LGGISDAFADSGNAAQLDLVAALRWVRENIANFGGDPGNVTVFGESGGGGKINALLSMPVAEGLFHKVVIESGSFWNDIPADEATDIARRVLAELSIPDHRLDRLRAVPPFRIVAAADRVWQRWGTNLAFRPVRDGRSIHQQFWNPTPPPWSASIPMLIGSNHDESVYLVADPRTEPATDADLVERIRSAQGMRKVTRDQAYTLIEGYGRIGCVATRLDLIICMAPDVFLLRHAVLQSVR